MDTFDVWLACKIRVAQLKPEVPAEALWSQKSSLFDAQVFADMTWHQFRWLNRHCAFASSDDPEGEEDSAESVERAADTHRKDANAAS